MEKIVVELEAKTDKALKGIEGVAKSVENLNKEVVNSNKDTANALKGVKGASESAAKGIKAVGSTLKAIGIGLVIAALSTLKDLFSQNQKVVDAGSVAFQTIAIVLKQVTDIISDVFKKVSEATGGFDALQKVIGGALTIALSSVLLVIQGVTLGVKTAQLAWENSFFGGKDKDKIKELNLSITETQGKLIETGNKIKNAGKDIATNFVEALGEVGSLAVGVVDIASKAIDEIDLKQALADGKRLANSKKNFERLAQEQTRLVEKYDLQAEQQRQIRDDESKSIAERIKANEDLGAILVKQNEAEKRTVQARIGALQEESRLKGATIELSNQIFELQTELIAVDAKVAGFQSEQQTNINSLKRENLEITNSQSESESKLSIERQRFDAELIANEILKLEKLKEVDLLFQEQEKIRLQTIIDNANLGTQAKVDAQITLDEFNEESRQTNLTRDNDILKVKEANGKLDLERTKKIEEEKQNSTTQAFGAVAGLLGQSSKFGKAVAIASAIRDTYAGASKALAQGGIFGTIAAAGVVASGLANVKQISATKQPAMPSFASGGGGGGSVPSIPSTPPAFNVVGQSDTNQLADAIGGQSKQPTKAYVVSGDVTNAQEMDRNIIQGASI